MVYSSNNVQQKYKKTGIETANQGKLIIMLYQGAIKFLNLAEKFIEEEKPTQANNHLIRVQDIINELRYSLDKESGGEIAQNLDALYDFINRQLIKANVKKDVKIIEQIRELIKDLLEGWQEANNTLAKNKRKKLKSKIDIGN